ncbi:DUF120 domain-containing protein [Halorhodospira halophila]|uniref:DUF120 domain-containing protein n=1 Tax=Halorhodospira halophila TaxID=1053 RepID=UPI0019137F1D
MKEDRLAPLPGRVQSGRGIATLHCCNHSKEIESALGYSPYPGSLNIILDQPVRLALENAYVFDHGHRYLWQARLLKHPVFLYRWDLTPLHICEIIADRNLRSYFHFQDGDRVTIEVGKCIPHAPDIFSKAGWFFLWFGRKKWFYTSDHYERWTRYYTWRLGAAQKPWTLSRTD